MNFQSSNLFLPVLSSSSKGTGTGVSSEIRVLIQGKIGWMMKAALTVFFFHKNLVT